MERAVFLVSLVMLLGFLSSLLLRGLMYLGAWLGMALDWHNRRRMDRAYPPEETE